MTNKIDIPEPQFYNDDLEFYPEIEQFASKIVKSPYANEFHMQEIIVNILSNPSIIESVAKIIGVIK